MRIIAGYLRGKKIIPPKDKNTRPLRDLVKESLFNIIKHSKNINCEIQNSKILDLFSGCGSFGLEAISRDAKKIVFVENYKNAINILKLNIKNLESYSKCKIIEKDCLDFINLIDKNSEIFDIIFLDPPYKYKKTNILIEKIIEKKILSKNGIMILHKHKKDDSFLTKKLNILDTRVYGISKIIFAN